MEDFSKIYNKYCEAMKQNTKGVQIGVYSIAFIGLTVAIRRVRPFSKFKRPSDIPNLFIRERRELQGLVERIEPNGALLMVKHKPLLPLMQTNGALPVKISGVDITGHGVNWLQAIVSGNKIKFIPIEKDANCIQCEVVLTQMTKKNKPVDINVGEALIAVGFGNIAPTNSINPIHKAYINTLRAAEDRALRKQMGIKYYLKPTKLILISLLERAKIIIEKMKQKQVVKAKKLTVT